MRPSHISYAFLGSFLIAVFALQWWPARTIPFGSGGQLSAYPYPIWIVIGIFGLGTVITAGRPSAIARDPSLIFLAMIIGTSVALWTVSHSTHIPSRETVDSYTGTEEVAIRGTIVDDPDRRALKTNYFVEVALLKNANGTRAVHGRVLLTVRIGHPLFTYGDVVVAHGVLEQPESDDDFRYDHYLSLKGIYSLMNDPLIEATGVNHGNVILRMIYRLRKSLEDRINILLPEPHASLLAGLLLGSRGSMPDDLTQDFKTTGLTHIVAISGFNITMLIVVMSTLLFWLPLKWRFWPSVILIAAFTLLTGASPSAVRAAVMGILGLLALQLNRMQTIRLTVLWAAFVMLVWNPKQLWYDAGFQLSFLALIGVMEISPMLQPYLRRVPQFMGIRESLCLTISAQMLASTWILYLFGQFSMIAPVSNLLAPPAIPYAMLLGTLSLLLGWIWMPLGKIIAAIAWLPLQWITGVAHILGSLPFAALQSNGVSTIWIVLYYGLLAGWIIRKNTLRLASSATYDTKQLAHPSTSLGMTLGVSKGQGKSLERFTIRTAELSSSRSTPAAPSLRSAAAGGS